MRTLLSSVIVLALPLAGAAGCGLLLNGSSQDITAQSLPAGVVILVRPEGGEYTTPATMSLERKKAHVLTFRKEGYTPATFEIKKSVSAGIVMLDLLAGGIVGLVVDATTGGWNRLHPGTASATLTKEDASIPGPARITVAVTRQGRTMHIESSEPGVEIRVGTK